MRSIAIAALVLSALTTQELPSAETLRKQMDEASEKRQSIQYVREITGEVLLNGQPVTEIRTGNQRVAVSSSVGKQTVAISNPGKARVELELGPGAVMVSDGETTWNYSPGTKVYSKVSAAQGPAGLTASLAVLDVMGFFEDPKTAKTVREESITVDGRSHDCWVVTSSVKIPAQAAQPGAQVSDGVMTSWIDKKLAIAVQQVLSYSYKVTAAGTTTPVEYQAKLKQAMLSLKVNEPVPATAFAFIPPADAREAPAQVGGRPRVDLTGREAPTFEAVSLDGKAVNLATLRGRPVLLDFWATWCGPCIKSMPALEGIYAEFKDKGLVILAVDVGEKRETVDAFLKTHAIPYPIVMGNDTTIPALYQVTGFPTFVLIGPDGKVAGHQLGFNNEAGLRELVAKAPAAKQ